jgi:hypothetical protein
MAFEIRAFALALSSIVMAPHAAHAAGFVENRGQFDPRAAFVCSDGATSVFATSGGFRFTRSAANGVGVAVFVDFGGVSRLPVALEPLPGRHHYLKGADPSQWVTDVESFDGVAYRAITPGIGVVLRSSDGAPTFDYVLAPGVDPAGIPALSLRGIEALRVTTNGDAEADSAIGVLRIRRPITLATGADGSTRELASRFELAGEHALRIVVSPARADERVLVDPELIFSTLLGGSAPSDSEYAYDVTYDVDGSPIIVGTTQGTGFPVTPGAFDPIPNGLRDAFVARFDPTGANLVFSTHIGGADYEEASAVARASDGSLFVTGFTYSFNFPLTVGAFDTTYAGGGSPDGFLLRLAADGSSLLRSTLFGGTSNEFPRDLALDSSNHAFVVGHTNSSDFPVTPAAYDTVNAGFDDAFVTKFAQNGASLVYSTFLGASGVLDNARGIALSGSGEAIVTGRASASFPVTQPSYDPTHNGALDAFVVRVNAIGTGLVAGTFLGGTTDDDSSAVAFGPDGSITITGQAAYVFPTTPGAFDTTPPINLYDTYVARFSGDLSSLIYSTYLGGEDGETPADVAVDAGGAAIVCGTFLNQTLEFPTTHGALETTTGFSYLSRLRKDGASLSYSTYLSNAASRPEGLAIGADGSVFVTGFTGPGFVVTPGAYDTTPGFGDIFLAKLDLCPGQVETVGAGCIGAGAFVPVLSVAGCPSPGFTLDVEVSSALGHTNGLLLVGLGSNSLPLNPNCALSIGPLVPSIAIPLAIPGFGPGDGSLVFSVPLSLSTPLFDIRMQVVIQDPNVGGGIAATNAIRLRVDD